MFAIANSFFQKFIIIELIASLFGFLIFDEIPDIWTIIGGLIIFSSILIITYRENYLKKDIAKQSIPVKL